MNIRKLIIVLCVLAFCGSGCSLLPQKPPTDQPKIVYADADKYFSEFQDALQYQHLNQTEQHNYGLLYTTVKDAVQVDSNIEDGDIKHPGVTVRFEKPLTRASMARLYESFLKDNPQLFFLDRTYSLEGHQNEDEAVYDTLHLRFTLDRKERKEATDRLDRAVESILINCPKTTDEYEIEKYLHDRLIAHCTYDELAASTGNDTHPNAYSAYGALVDGWAVCEGYSKAMQLLLNKMSISSTVIMGCSADDAEAHMWNLVRINDAYYYLDVTWDDTDDVPQYVYFNMTYETMLRTHIPDNEQFMDTTCTSVKDNFFVRNGTYCDIYDRQHIAKIIATHIQAGESIVHLQFAPGKFENALLFLKNTQLTKKTINNHLKQDVTMWDYTLHTQSKQNAITLIRIT